MMIIRPVTINDQAAILELAHKTGVGFTSLPKNEESVRQRIERMLSTWHHHTPLEEQGYLFVLEDSEQKKVVGISGIEVAIGLDEPWYHYRIGTLVHASEELNIYKKMPTLFLTNDRTGYSELCTLFLDPEYRHSKNGHLLAKTRFLFMANFQDQFSDRVIAEMRGYSDEKGRSPFWEGLGRHFFDMEFSEADYRSGMGQKKFIAELMPKHPLYVDFLSQETRDVIGQVHPQTAPAAEILKAEGMKFEGGVDIFDAGPTLEARIEDLRAMKESQVLQIEVADKDMDLAPEPYLLANLEYLNYRSLLAHVYIQDDRVYVAPDILKGLEVKAGDEVRLVSLFPAK
ncbi:MAG: arginine N-succinyltransferase [Vibrio sp.]